MPRQNRVTPLGELIADPARGLVYGNRGCLHGPDGRVRRRYAGRRWIACRLSFRGWNRGPLMQPGHFTELFFLDDATALAAGHRPCALCRRGDYERLAHVWADRHEGRVGADAIDAQLHDERLERDSGAQLHHDVPFDDLPDGAFVLHDGGPHIVWGRALVRWSPRGYERPVPRPTRLGALAITPPSLLAVLREGWDPVVPFVHPSVGTRNIISTKISTDGRGESATGPVGSEPG